MKSRIQPAIFPGSQTFLGFSSQADVSSSVELKLGIGAGMLKPLREKLEDFATSVTS